MNNIAHSHWHIGTSGWHYPAWRNTFYPETISKQDWIRFYAMHFNTVEVNTTFYTIPAVKQFHAWLESVHHSTCHFTFALKLPALFTHKQRLTLDAQHKELLTTFISNATTLGSALGPLLIQCLPTLSCQLETLSTFLDTITTTAAIIQDALPAHIPTIRFAIEFRHASWFTDTVYELLKHYNIALVISDAFSWPTAYVHTTDFSYLRLHGKPTLFVSPYTDEQLHAWKERIHNISTTNHYIYFNNTMSGYAPYNAQLLSILLKTD